MIMMQGTYYKEWSSVLNREMEFKVYGSAGVPVLALPARGGRFFDWENNGMPDAIAQLLNEGKIQLFCADSVDGEGVLNGDLPLRRRAEAQEKYFVYLTAELAPRILTLNKAEKGTKIWCAGVDLGAYQAVNCRLRRPNLFAGAVGMGGIYDLSRFWGVENDDLVLRCSPLLYLQENGIANKLALVKAEENSLILCAGQGAYEDDAKADTRVMCPTTGTGGARCGACLLRAFWKSNFITVLCEGKPAGFPSFFFYFKFLLDLSDMVWYTPAGSKRYPQGVYERSLHHGIHRKEALLLLQHRRACGGHGFPRRCAGRCPLLLPPQGPQPGGIQSTGQPAEPHRRPGARRARHAGKGRLLCGHSGTGGRRELGTEQLCQGAAGPAHEHLCGR